MNKSRETAEETDPLSESRTVGSVRKVIETQAVDSLVVDDLKVEDLPHVKWAGGQHHLKAIKEALDRVSEGEVEYLAVRAPNGNPVSIGGIDYAVHEGAGTLWQLATRGELIGLGSRLIAAAEERIRRRGVSKVMIGVEDNNPKARALYERLGYMPVGREKTSWQYQDERGQIKLYETELTLLEKRML